MLRLTIDKRRETDGVIDASLPFVRRRLFEDFKCLKQGARRGHRYLGEIVPYIFVSFSFLCWPISFQSLPSVLIGLQT